MASPIGCIEGNRPVIGDYLVRPSHVHCVVLAVAGALIGEVFFRLLSPSQTNQIITGLAAIVGPGAIVALRLLKTDLASLISIDGLDCAGIDRAHALISHQNGKFVIFFITVTVTWMAFSLPVAVFYLWPTLPGDHPQLWHAAIVSSGLSIGLFFFFVLVYNGLNNGIDNFRFVLVRDVKAQQERDQMLQDLSVSRAGSNHWEGIRSVRGIS
ncbi:MAG: hypothetical protein QM803_11575 [Rhodocyclaceae bacterium]